MKRKEPLAGKEEFDKKVAHIDRAPTIDLGSHGTAHLLCGEKFMLSFVDMPANSYAEPHRHKDIEQGTIILKGDADFVVEGKLYPVHEGDVLIFGPNEEHGAYVGPNGAKVLDVFSPHREDLLEKLHKATSPTE